jgi:hypothetical protein
MKKCKYCQTEIQRQAKVCPQCKRDLRNWFIRHPILTAVIVLVVLAVVGVGEGGSSKYNQTGVLTESSSSTSTTEQDLELLEHKLTKEDYITKVTGKIRNNTNKTFRYAQVEINLYDKDNVLLDSTLANINNFEGGTVWKFEAVVIKSGHVASYKIKDITKW